MSNPNIQCPHCGQPVAASASPGQLIQCPSCHNTFPAQSSAAVAAPAFAQAVGYATPAGFSGSRLSNGAAKFSLICGISFFFLLLIELLIGAAGGGGTPAAGIFLVILSVLAPILAVIFGIVALVRTRNGHRSGKGMAITGISLGGVGVLILLVGLVGFVAAGVLSPSLNRARETANRVKCAANLKQIGLAMELYANENKGQYPPRPQDLILTQDITPDVFICPSSNDVAAPGSTMQQQAAKLSTGGHDSYIYLGAGKNATTPANVVLAYEPLTNHQSQGMNVLFGDGSVTFVSGPMAQKVDAELKAGQNPPPSYH